MPACESIVSLGRAAERGSGPAVWGDCAEVWGNQPL